MEHGIEINDLVYSPDGAYLASSGIDGVLIVWDAGTGEQLARKEIGGELYGMAFNPSGNVLAAAHPNGTVLLFEPSSLEELLVLSGHTAGVNKVAFSPDGTRLASAGLDSTAREWDIGPSHELLTITDEGGPLRVAYSPDGQYLATTNYAGSVTLWDAKTGELIWQLFDHLQLRQLQEQAQLLSPGDPLFCTSPFHAVRHKGGCKRIFFTRPARIPITPQ